jgi:SAM-dependent methyltransferase
MSNENPADNCRICNSSLSVTILSDLKTGMGEIYGLKQCKVCSFVSTDPLPSAEELGQYYNQDYWQHGDGRTGRLLNLLFKFRMSGILSDLKKLVPQKGRILDWGAGDGKLVQLLKKEGFVGYGIDIYSAELNQNNLFSATIEDAPFKNEFFDAVTCFHVLEHIDRPIPSIKRAFQLLKPGGILVLEVPNIASIGFQVFKKNWYPLDIPVHLNHFSPLVMQRIFDNIGRSQVVKVDCFSQRHSPGSLVLSLIPAISPPKVRARHGGRFPLSLMILYLLLQLISYPFALIEALIHRGEIFRMYVRKKA